MFAFRESIALPGKDCSITTCSSEIFIWLLVATLPCILLLLTPMLIFHYCRWVCRSASGGTIILVGGPSFDVTELTLLPIITSQSLLTWYLVLSIFLLHFCALHSPYFRCPANSRRSLSSRKRKTQRGGSRMSNTFYIDLGELSLLNQCIRVYW